MSSIGSEIKKACVSFIKNWFYVKKEEGIFLTGATGFLGAFLLQELLEQTDSKIYCLVRPKRNMKAQQRLIETMKYYYLWKDAYISRIEVLVGDLAKPNLGLSDDQFNTLAGKIDSIYHVGAYVNFIYSYEALEPTNVGGTDEILRLATLKKVKPVHYTSSMNVFSLKDIENSTIVYEDSFPSLKESTDTTGDKMPRELKLLGLGYLQTKRVSERHIKSARSRGVQVNIYRVGRISGHSKTGACQTNDFFWRTVKASIPIGKWPDVGALIDFIPVDYTCKVIVHIARRSKIIGKNFHLFNRESFPHVQVIDCIKRQGYAVELCTYEEWLGRMKQKVRKTSERAAYSMAPMEPQSGDVFAGVYYDDGNTREALKGSGIVCPPVDQKLLDIYFDYFKAIGYFDTPNTIEQQT
ncbi:MAG TPA: thioester reductase domain-containing protein [Pseudobacteroides sp.]|uniref:thioester reductase domain-containing protein n=1 Tax=Pseudobacteroides sp. TaxID=1968840 RepID=UPI002F93630A